MAIPNNYIDKIKDKDSGESRPICPPADHVSVDNENYEGETLDEVLDEVSQAIEEAGQGGYAPPAGGIPKTDLAQSVQDSLDKADSALQDEDVAEVAKTGDYDDLQNKPTIPDTSGFATKTELNAKQDKIQAGNGIVIGTDGKTVSVAEAIRAGAAAGATAVQPGVLDSAMATKQNVLTFDDAPTANSDNPVKSKGVKQAIDEKLSNVTVNAIPAGSVGIIDDCVTDSNTDALSARQGKELNDRLEKLEEGLIYDKTDVDSLVWVNGNLKNYSVNVGNTYTPNVTESSDAVYCALPVQAGDVVTFWCKTDSWSQGYLLCDSSNKVVAKSGNWTDRAESNPFVLTIEQAGTLYISSNKGDAHGGSRSRTYKAIRPATTTNDGIMTKEQVAQLDAAGGPDVDVLKSYVGDRTDTTNGEYIVGHLDNYGKSVGQTYTGTPDSNQDYVYCEINVYAGEVVTIWGKTDSHDHLYLLCDANNVITKASGVWANVTESSPTTLNITADGKLWASSKKSANYGLTKSRTYRSFRIADAEHDGLMPKEIAAMFGGNVSGDDAASLKLKSFAFIGDSFSAPGSWQSTMVSILGALSKKNKAVSGGTWVGTGSVSAYYQAQQLVSDGVACDYILCVLGTNDINNNVALGDIVNSETIGTASGNVNPDGSITGGIQATLITLKNAFPNAIIKIGYTPAGYIHDAFGKIASIEALCNRLKELSYIYGAGYIETRDCGICPWMAGDAASFVSGGHPTGNGQTRIGQYMARKMLSNL